MAQIFHTHVCVCMGIESQHTKLTTECRKKKRFEYTEFKKELCTVCANGNVFLFLFLCMCVYINVYGINKNCVAHKVAPKALSIILFRYFFAILYTPGHSYIFIHIMSSYFA